MPVLIIILVLLCAASVYVFLTYKKNMQEISSLQNQLENLQKEDSKAGYENVQQMSQTPMATPQNAVNEALTVDKTLSLGGIQELLSQMPLVNSTEYEGAHTILQLAIPGKQIFRVPIESEVVIGRKSGDILLSFEPSVSGTHCKICKFGSTYTVTDLGSSNGTFVNGNRIEGPMQVQSGDRLLIGRLEIILTIEEKN